MTVDQTNDRGLYVFAAIKEEEPDVFGKIGLLLIRREQTLS